jgi:DivIVA domain-containing protein
MTGVPSTFPRSGFLSRGYDVDQVDAFFARARVAYEQAGRRAAMTSRDVRKAGFDLVRGGYDVAQVDSALDRLEDAFAAREQQALSDRLGEQGALDALTRRARDLRGRLVRPDGERFDRATGFTRGYAVADVDALCAGLLRYFEEGEDMSVDEVRRAVFRTRFGSRAYAEAQVDAFLDRVVEVMLAAAV